MPGVASRICPLTKWLFSLDRRPDIAATKALIRPALGGITAAGFLLRLGYVLTFSDRIHFGLDTIWYELVSGTIVSGDGYVDPGKFYGKGVAVATAFRPPLYPWFLALISDQISSSQRTFQVVGCVVGLVTIVLIGLLAAGSPATPSASARLRAPRSIPCSWRSTPRS